MTYRNLDASVRVLFVPGRARGETRQRRGTKLASLRQRRLRERQRRGDIVVPLEASNALIETLLDLGWLDEAVSEDRVKPCG